mmetsp:Transcript_92636/g.241352  ORF Transcript_92636/g.241352 Transcript_92636/m.241352 type:complete len:281 (-) Transcript_92636:35-877(-)
MAVALAGRSLEVVVLRERCPPASLRIHHCVHLPLLDRHLVRAAGAAVVAEGVDRARDQHHLRQARRVRLGGVQALVLRLHETRERSVADEHQEDEQHEQILQEDDPERLLHHRLLDVDHWLIVWVLRLDNVHLLFGVVLQTLHDLLPNRTLQVRREEQEYYRNHALDASVGEAVHDSGEIAGLRHRLIHGLDGTVQLRGGEEEREDHEGAEGPLEEVNHGGAAAHAALLTRLAMQLAAELPTPFAEKAGEAADALEALEDVDHLFRAAGARLDAGLGRRG